MAEFLHWQMLQEKPVWISNANISKLIKSPSFYDFLFREGLLFISTVFNNSTSFSILWYLKYVSLLNCD